MLPCAFLIIFIPFYPLFQRTPQISVQQGWVPSVCFHHTPMIAGYSNFKSRIKLECMSILKSKHYWNAGAAELEGLKSMHWNVFCNSSRYSFSTHFSSQKLKHPFASSVLWFIYLKYLIVKRARKSKKPSSISFPVNSQLRNRDTKQRGEQCVLTGWIFGTFSSQHTPYKHTNVSRPDWPIFIPLHPSLYTEYGAIVKLPLNFSFITMTRGLQVATHCATNGATLRIAFPSPSHHDLPWQLSLSDCTEDYSTTSLPLKTFTLPGLSSCLAQRPVHHSQAESNGGHWFVLMTTATLAPGISSDVNDYLSNLIYIRKAGAYLLGNFNYDLQMMVYYVNCKASLTKCFYVILNDRKIRIEVLSILLQE